MLAPPPSRAHRFCTSAVLLSILLVFVASAHNRALAAPETSSTTGAFDGPAELPRIFVNSSLADTPAPGPVLTAATSAELQTALDSAQCGDTISLKAGATFTGSFTFPAKACDDAHWIIVRTSAADSELPPEGTRLTPCYAGVASLPGRPDFQCASTKNVLAKIVYDRKGGTAPLIWADGANHYRLIGLEITRTPGHIVYHLAVAPDHVAYNHIVFDRVWMHGTAHDDTTRGIGLGGGTYVAVVDSFFTDFHCEALGICVDSQTISGGLGDRPMGPYKIVNNFLEASGENIMFGGGPATQTPADIEVRHNHLFKPTIWRSGQTNFVGGVTGHPFIVKNHFELKNAARVLFEGNVLENSWGGFTQSGFSILLTPKNQNGACATCAVHDVTIRYSTISHVGGGFQIGNGASHLIYFSKGAWNESIHDLVVSDISAAKYNGHGALFQEGNRNPSVIHDVRIAHVTGFGDALSTAFVIGNSKSNRALYNFSWVDNIFSVGQGLGLTGGGATNCAFDQAGALGKLNACFKPYSFTGNVLIGATGSWPVNNLVAATLAQVFGNAPLGSLDSFTLPVPSRYRQTGLSGTDPGADISAVEAAIAGAQ